MLLEYFRDEKPVFEAQRRIKIYPNGVNMNNTRIQISILPDTLMSSIKRFLELKLNKGNQFLQLRLFNVDGVEVFQEDFQFLKQDSDLYASFQGEDFDQNTGFSQYEIIKLLGEGGFGKVLLGQHLITKQKVAIKIVNTASIGNAEDIDMVFREAEMLKSLVHKNIVKIYNSYTLPNMNVVFIMEYLEGGELLQFVQGIQLIINIQNKASSRNLKREFFFSKQRKLSSIATNRNQFIGTQNLKIFFQPQKLKISSRQLILELQVYKYLNIVQDQHPILIFRKLGQVP